ncbi:hypothetical protein SAMN04490197_2990 [Pseudomonas orientalis]|uniref:Uncharacterized protein n=1 Tax=Pseudomonas orientalis TaxID=76758 RepID=A0A8B3XYV5_9PSED|nr:hypothetical protein SAMN04490197_2990 [Pseudomonas orientalis]
MGHPWPSAANPASCRVAHGFKPAFGQRGLTGRLRSKADQDQGRLALYRGYGWALLELCRHPCCDDAGSDNSNPGCPGHPEHPRPAFFAIILIPLEVVVFRPRIRLVQHVIDLQRQQNFVVQCPTAAQPQQGIPAQAMTIGFVIVTAADPCQLAPTPSLSNCRSRSRFNVRRARRARVWPLSRSRGSISDTPRLPCQPNNFCLSAAVVTRLHLAVGTDDHFGELQGLVAGVGEQIGAG